MKAKEKPKVVKPPQLKMRLAFKSKNYILLGAGIVSIVVGFISLASGSVILAPVLLVLGFCVLVPVGILIK